MPEKKVISIEDRIPTLKEARRKKANRRTIYYVVIFFLLILIIVYLQSPLSNVKHIKVTGNITVETEEIIKTSELTTENNIWGLNMEKLEKNITSLPKIKTAVITRKLPNTVTIEVEEFEKVGYIHDNGIFYPVLENGQALKNEIFVQPKSDAPILIGFSDSTYLSEMTVELQKLHKELSALISEIHWIPDTLNPYKLRLYMVNGREVITSIRNFSEKMKVYPSIAVQLDDSQKGYINLDLGTYFVPYDTPLNEGETEDESEG